MRGITVIFSPQGNLLNIQPELLPFFQGELTYNDLVLLLALLAGCSLDTAGELAIRTSPSQIARQLGFSLQTARAGLARLEQAGWFDRQSLPGKKTIYRLNARPQGHPTAFIHICSGGQA